MAEIREEDLMENPDTGEEMMVEEEMPLETGAPEEGAAEAEAISPIVLTPNELKELEGMEIGDTITLTVTNITDDGSYELAPELPTTGTEAVMEEEIPGGGAAAIEQALL